MGLELVEYVIAIEEAFEIDIPDSDAVRLDTPAKLIDYLCAHLAESADGPPLAQSAFYWLRTALIEELGIPRHESYRLPSYMSSLQLDFRPSASRNHF